MLFINENNNVVVRNDKIIFDMGNELFLFRIEEIKSISLTTTEQLLFKQKVFLTFVTDYDLFVMGIIHPAFKRVLKDVCERFDVDYRLVIDAMQSDTQQTFILYQGRE